MPVRAASRWLVPPALAAWLAVACGGGAAPTPAPAVVDAVADVPAAADATAAVADAVADGGDADAGVSDAVAEVAADGVVADALPDGGADGAVDAAPDAALGPSCAGDPAVLALQDFESPAAAAAFPGPPSSAAITTAWRLDTKRAHSGAHALYFGNDCHSQDAAASIATGCQSSGTSMAVAGKVSLGAFALPTDPGTGKTLPATLSFWIWVDLPDGDSAVPAADDCSPACASNTHCVNFGGGAKSACLVVPSLVLSVGASVVWSPVSFGNTTNGGWRHVVLALGGLSNPFSLDATISGTKGASEGVYLDDVVVTLDCGQVAACSASQPCAVVASACADNACTWVANAPANGYCFASPLPGCCTASCDDGNACTVDTCVAAPGAPTGTCASVPDASQPACCTAAPFWADNFDGLTPPWPVSPGAAGWSVSPTAGMNGSGALELSTVAATSSVICTPPLTLDSGTVYDVGHLLLRMQTAWCGVASYVNPPGSQASCSTNSGCSAPGESCSQGQCVISGPIDRLSVTFKVNGAYCGASGCAGSVQALAKPLWSSDAIAGCAVDFTPISFPLTNFAGATGQLCFAYAAGGASPDAVDIAIDNLSLDVTCTGS